MPYFAVYPTRQIVMSVWANFADIYLRGIRDKSKPTDWSTAAGKGKLVFVILIMPSLAQFVSLFTTGENRL